MRFIHDELVREGHAVDYLCAEDLPERWRGALARFAFPWLVRNKVVEAASSGAPYDVVNVHEPSSAFVGAVRGGTGGTKVSVISHGVEQRGWELALDEARAGREGPSLKSRIVHPLTSLWQSRMGLRRADHIFCLSFQDRDYLVQRLGIPAERITRVAPAADPVYFEAGKRRVYGDVRRLLFFGTWLKRKGTDELVEAFASLAETHPALRLSVIGAGVPPERVAADFPARVRDRVDCYQNLTEAEIAELLLEADVFILPSVFEGTPQTLVEAMATGMPVVTTATSGMRDVIRDGENGLLVATRSAGEIRDAVERLMRDRELRERIGRKARDEAEADYRWARVAEPFRSVYLQLTGERVLDA